MEGWGNGIARRTARAALAVAALAAAACSSGGTSGPAAGSPVLVLGVARHDLSPRQPLEGLLALFFDRDGKRLLTAQASVNDVPLDDPVAVGLVPGELYVHGTAVHPGESYTLEATVDAADGPLTVHSSAVQAPAALDVELPAEHAAADPLTVNWDPPADADRVFVSAGSGFSVDVPAGTGTVEIPAVAFAGVTPGDAIEVEVTAYNGFFATISSAAAALSDPDAVEESLGAAANVEGASGAFGAATTVGALVTIR